MPVVSLPAPVALARLADSLAPPGVADPVWEPKFDGYRALAAGGKLYSRRGTNLTPFSIGLIVLLASKRVVNGGAPVRDKRRAQRR